MNAKKKHATAEALKTDMQTRLFFLILLVLAAILAAKIWPIRGIYLSKTIRAGAENAFLQMEKNEGWLYSDMVLTAAGPDSITIIYEPHKRGIDTTQCITAKTATYQLQRCDAAR